MADRRGDDASLPRRSLSGPKREESGSGGQSKRDLTKRVSAAVAAAGTAVGSARGSSGSGSATVAAAANRSGTTSGRAGSTGSTGAGAAARTGSAKTTAGTTKTSPAGRPRGTRRARLRLIHLDPWSVMKTSFLLSIAFGIVLVVAVAVVWSVLGAAGVWDSINRTVSDVLGGDAQQFDVQNYVGTSRVLGFTMVVAAVDVVLITAISTLSAFLYNLAAALLGGVEVTLAEDER
jgi:Transmembrane domain of unknown function (DUF3566)